MKRRTKIILFLFIAAFTIVSCELLYDAIPPVDWNYNPPEEPPIDSISVDTCGEYIIITEPPFITGILQFDVIPSSIVWMYGNNPIDINVLFPNHELYRSGHNLSLIVNGTNNHTQYQSKIWTRDGSGAKNYLTFFKQYIDLYGSVTPDQFLSILENHPSARRIGFYNTGNWSCQDYNNVVQFLRDNCISGQGKIIDLRFAICEPSPELMEYLADSGWNVLQ